MGFNFNIFTLGGGSGSGSGSGIAKYPNAAALPGSAADGDVAITLDTNNLYSYDSGVVAWVIIGGPGVAVTFGDSASVLTNFLGNVATSYLNIEGITNPPSSWGVSLVIGNSGLYAYQRGYPVYGQTSATWNTVGQTATVLGGSLLLDIRPASGSNSGLVNTDTQSFSGDKFFNNLIAGFSGFGMISGAGGPGTIYLGAPNSVPSSYNWIWPSAQGGTYLVLTNDGQGNLSWSAGSSAAQTRLGPFSYVSFAQGATINGVTFQLGWADLTNPGSVGVTTQEFAGLKTFSNNILTPQVSGTTASAGNLILNSTSSGTVGNVLINTNATGGSGFLGIGMTTPQAGIHYAAGTLNRSVGTVGANAVILGRLNPAFNVSQGVFMANGTDGGNRAGTRDVAVFGSSNSIGASSEQSLIAGLGNIITGVQCFAAGTNNEAGANNSVSLGAMNISRGIRSFSMGDNTFAQGQNQFVIGEFNASQGTTNTYAIGDQLFIIGNGILTAKKNAFSVSRNAYQQWYGTSAGFLSISAGLSLAGYTLIMPLTQGSTFTTLQNDGLGNLSWVTGGGGNYQTVTNAGATLALQTRFVDVTTGVTNQTLNIGWAASGNTGVTLDVIKIDSGLGTVTIQAPDLINGATNYVLNSQWQTARLVCNGLGFRVL